MSISEPLLINPLKKFLVPIFGFWSSGYGACISTGRSGFESWPGFKILVCHLFKFEIWKLPVSSILFSSYMSLYRLKAVSSEAHKKMSMSDPAQTHRLSISAYLGAWSHKYRVKVSWPSYIFYLFQLIHTTNFDILCLYLFKVVVL